MTTAATRLSIDHISSFIMFNKKGKRLNEMLIGCTILRQKHGRRKHQCIDGPIIWISGKFRLISGKKLNFGKLFKKIILFTTGNVHFALIAHDHVSTKAFDVFDQVININHVTVMNSDKPKFSK